MTNGRLKLKLVACQRLYPKVIQAKHTMADLRTALRAETASVSDQAAYPLLAGLYYKDADDFTLVREGRYSGDHLHIFLGDNKFWLATFRLSEPMIRYHHRHGDQRYKTPLDIDGRPIEPDGLVLPMNKLLPHIDLRRSPRFREVPDSGQMRVRRFLYQFGSQRVRPANHKNIFILEDLKKNSGQIFVFAGELIGPLMPLGKIPVKKHNDNRPESALFVPAVPYGQKAKIARKKEIPAHILLPILKRA